MQRVRQDWVLSGTVHRQPYRPPQNHMDREAMGRTPALAQASNVLGRNLWHEASYRFDLSYAHKVTDKEMVGGNSIWFAANYEANPDLYALVTDKGKTWAPESKASLGYMIALASQGQRQSTIKGKIDTEGMVSGVVEETVTGNVAVVLSAALDHAAEEYRFGFGLQVGS